MTVTPLTWLKAKAIQAGVAGMIGEQPAITQHGDQYLEIDFSEAQAAKMQAYLDTQVRGLFERETAAAPDLQVRFGKVLVPWSAKYLAPAILAVFAMGFMSNSIIFGRRR